MVGPEKPIGLTHQPYVIRLTFADWCLAQEIAEARERNGKNSHHPHELQDADGEVAGAMAEIAFARHFNLEPPTLEWKDHDLGGADFFLDNGLAVDVKASTKWPNLQVKFPRADVFFHAMVDVPRGIVRFVGFAWAREVRAAAQFPEKYSGKRILHRVAARKLHDFESFDPHGL